MYCGFCLFVCFLFFQQYIFGGNPILQYVGENLEKKNVDLNN